MAVFTCIPKLGKTGGGIQWDNETGKALARFDKDGFFETEDKAVIGKLKSLGYKAVAQETNETDAAEDKPKTK